MCQGGSQEVSLAAVAVVPGEMMVARMGEAAEMLTGGPGSIFKELMIRVANGVKERSRQQLQGFDLRTGKRSCPLLGGKDKFGEQ